MGIINSSAAGRMRNCRSSWSRSNPICSKESTPRWRPAGLRPEVIRGREYGDLQRLSLQLSEVTDSSLVVDIGARTTICSSLSRERFFRAACQSVASAVTAALAKEFNESFLPPKRAKRESGFVSLGGAYADPADADVARMSKIIRSTMTRLHAEIMRSISHYRTQQAGQGAGANLSLRRQLGDAVYARIFSGKIAGPDRIL